MKQRLMRILIIVAAAFLAVGGVKWIVGQSQKNPGILSLSTEPVRKKLQQVGDNVLGEMVKHLPDSPDLEKVGKEEMKKTEQSNQDNGQKKQSREPISQPVQNIENQTQVLIETIKKLPQDQIEAIKKQIWKEFCQQALNGGKE